MCFYNVGEEEVDEVGVGGGRGILGEGLGWWGFDWMVVDGSVSEVGTWRLAGWVGRTSVVVSRHTLFIYYRRLRNE